jgi:hypothetical protein
MAVISITPKKSPGIESYRVTADYLRSSLVVNGSQQTIPSGCVVYVQDSNCGCHCEVYPALASGPNTSGAIGITAAAVFVGKHTRVAIAGSVPFILEDGSAVPENGDVMYLSGTQAGAVTSTIPDFQENSIVVIGKILSGKMILNVSQTAVAADGVNAGGAPAVAPPGGNV